jgi:quercetin dioxygenase-like cupin family protein
MEFPDPRFEKPILMKPQMFHWVPDRKIDGVEYKHLGTFGERRSGMSFMRLKLGAKIPARVQEDAQILYLTDGAITYGGKTWEGGKSKDKGTYIYIPPNANVGEIAAPGGAEFFIISLPMIADIEAELKTGRSNRRAA